jgi:hypothetical protein
MLNGTNRSLPVWCLVAAFAAATVVIPMGCRERGPAEGAGRDIDRGIEDAGDAVQDLGRDIEDAGRGRR